MMDHHGIYDLARHHQAEIRQYAREAGRIRRDGVEVESTRHRLMRAYRSLIALLV